MRNYPKGSPILPLGKINVSTGNSKYFNVYETWGDETTYEIYETEPNKFKIVAGSGIDNETSYMNKFGKYFSFYHDQTFRPLFDGKLVNIAYGKQLSQIAKQYGKSISGYCYK